MFKKSMIEKIRKIEQKTMPNYMFFRILILKDLGRYWRIVDDSGKFWGSGDDLGRFGKIWEDFG